MSKILKILQNLGITDEPDQNGYIKFCPSFRGSDGKNASINVNSGLVTDFVTGEFYNINELFERFTGKQLSKEDLLSIKSSNFVPPEKEANYWSKDSLLHLLPDHTYWLNRGVSKETLDFFQGGVSHGGKLIMRYVWPVFDRHQRIIGFTGRDLTGKSDKKYKHEGISSNFLFGLFNKRDGESPILKNIIQTRHVILVEGPSDSVACFDEGLHNVLPIMGLTISKTLISFLVGINPKKITLATNRDENFRGQNAAVKNYTKLAEHFDRKILEIKFPVGNDLAERKDEIKNFNNLPSANVLGEFRAKYLRCEKDRINKVKNAVRFTKKELDLGKILGENR